MASGVRGLVPACLLLALAACGGGGSSNGGGGTGGGTPPPPPAPQNPCVTAAIEGDAPLDAPASSQPAKKNVIDGSTRWRVLDELWRHRQGQLRARERQPRLTADTAPPGRQNIDVGEIAVVPDEGDLVQAANVYDLLNLGLRFTRNASGGYDVQRIDGTFRSSLGTRVMLTDDDSTAVNVPFGVAFYGKTYPAGTAAFVNSDGNVTFDEEDKASTERNVARLLTGPPRIAPFLSDLDPTTGSSRIFVNAAADQYTVTWCNVRGFESQGVLTAQATLLPDGTIEFKYADVGLGDAVVGLSPGRTAVFTPLDLSSAGPSAGGSAALGERFAVRAELDTVALIKKFYRTHNDRYDQLVIWTDTTYVERGSFAYESTIANEVRGIGVPVFDLSREFGSGGQLRSMAMMDAITKYPREPFEKFLGENNTLSVLGQEVGHRWLAFVEFRDRNRERSDQLLGRGQSHWSFFLDSDASVMEGNDIEQQADGSFKTVAAVQRYSALDQYLMGLIPPQDVPTFFYVEEPMNIRPIRDRDDAPLVGVTFAGTKREVLIDDVIAIHGDRLPPAAQSAKIHRQAFIYVPTGGRTADPAHIEKIDRIRREWETFFQQATSGRMTAITRLQ